MKPFRLSGPARDDVRAIWQYLRDQSPQAAARVRADLEAAMSRLAEHPGMGHLRADLTDQPLRFKLVHRYLIVYLPGTRPLQIVRVLHSARDLPPMLES